MWWKWQKRLCSCCWSVSENISPKIKFEHLSWEISCRTVWSGSNLEEDYSLPGQTGRLPRDPQQDDIICLAPGAAGDVHTNAHRVTLSCLKDEEENSVASCIYPGGNIKQVATVFEIPESQLFGCQPAFQLWITVQQLLLLTWKDSTMRSKTRKRPIMEESAWVLCLEWSCSPTCCSCVCLDACRGINSSHADCPPQH